MENSLKEFDKVLADFNEIKETGNFLPDCTTKSGYLASKEFVLKMTTPARTALSKAHKDAKAFYLEGGRTVDAKKNELMLMIEEVEKPHQEAYRAKDEEVKRIRAEREAAIQNGFDYLKGFVEIAINQDSETISFLLDECAVFDADPNVYRKEIGKVVSLHQKVMSQLTDALTHSLQIEDMKRQQDEMNKRQAEIDAKYAEQKRREDKEREDIHAANLRETMRLEAEEAAQAEVARLKKEAEDAEARRVAQECQAKLFAEDARAEAKRQSELAAAQAVQDEKDRQESERLQLEADAKDREADKKHRGIINSQALYCLMQGGLSEDQAKLAIKLIASRKISHTQINY
jgi:putative hemolysin